jgi:hypothetical protein
MEELFRGMKRKLEDVAKEEIPNSAHKAFVPQNVPAELLLIQAQQTSSQHNMPTFIMGTIARLYTEDMFAADVQRVGQHFGIDTTNPDQVRVIKMKPILKDDGTASDLLDADQAVRDILGAIAVLNHHTLAYFRIIRLGPTGTKLFYQGVKQILKKWQTTGPKQIQFVTTSDSEDEEILRFCKSLCLSGLCHQIQYYNTQDYHPFGDFHSEWYHP